MRVSIIGCGLIGQKRATAIKEIGEDTIISCCDTNNEIVRNFSNEFINSDFSLHPTYFTDYKELLQKSICDTVIIAVTNKYAKDIVIDCLKADKNVLVEKPFGRNYQESLKMIDYQTNKIFKVGFNHKFHPAIWKAKEIFDSGGIGKPIIIRAHYGHGGRKGMEKEWRSSKELCGGGELLDQGVHLIDLSRWFTKGINEVFGKIETKFWDIEVEDNAFMLLKSTDNVDIQLHVSWTNWKNSFLFEIFGTEGYLKISGLGGWYGAETLEWGKRTDSIPEVQKFEFTLKDISWEDEWLNFKSNTNINNAIDGLKANQIIDAVYRSALENKIIKI